MDRHDEHTVFTEEALKSQDGKKVPLTSKPGGPVIGEATMKYNPETKRLEVQVRVDDPKVAEFFKQDPSSIIFKKES